MYRTRGGSGVNEFTPPTGSRLTSGQTGSIISSTQNSFHVRVSQAMGLRRSHTVDDGIEAFQLSKPDSVRAATTWLGVNVTVNGIEGTVLPGGVSIHGVGEGTNVFEVCLFEDHMDGHQRESGAMDLDCVVESVLTIEVFSAQAQVVHQRSSYEMQHSSNEVMGSSGAIHDDMEDSDEYVEPRRIVFITDLKVVDGFKLSMLHLLKHLPRNFRASTLDVSCVCEYLKKRNLFLLRSPSCFCMPTLEAEARRFYVDITCVQAEDEMMHFSELLPSPRALVQPGTCP